MYSNFLTSLPDSVCNLKKLFVLCLFNNQLTVLPESIGEFPNIEEINLRKNYLTSLPKSILKIKDKLIIDDSSYQLDNFDQSCEFLIFKSLVKPLDNLPYNLKELWFTRLVNNYQIKLPFGCVIKYYVFL
jgi:Leucine-rich repeat (LRR) protein